MKYLLDNIENNICTLTINRPKQNNALNLDVLIELDTKLDMLKKSNKSRVIILTGMGEKSFIAGADIKMMQGMNESEAQEFSKMGQDLSMKIEKFSIPIIAAVNGYALGGGCEFAMACHIRYASHNAIFGQPEVRLGLIAGWGGTQRLPRLVGKGHAMELLLSGNNINAENAASLGLINKVVSLPELIPSVNKLASAIIKNPPLAVAATIKAINNREHTVLKDGFSSEQNEFAKLFKSTDTKEGLSAFLEKRKPKYFGS